MNKYIILGLFAIFFCGACGHSITNSEFIAKYSHESFSKFKETSLVIRGYDNGNPIIFMYSYINDSISHNGFKRFIIDKNCNTILRENVNFFSDSTETVINDNERFLALKFCSYRIYSLTVKSDNNVIVRVSSDNDSYSLIKFRGTYEIPPNWKRVNEDWYEIH
jgi:hypothetical protein